MKKFFALLGILAVLLSAGCVSNPAPKTEVETTNTTTEFDEEYVRLKGLYRPIYYSMGITYIKLVGKETYNEWENSRSEEERNNECIAVSFVKRFNIKREDIEQANKEKIAIWEEAGVDLMANAAYEVYDVDLIYTFDNEKINEFFLWENGPYPLD